MNGEGPKSLEFTIKGPVPILLEDDLLDYRSGCSILDISFNEPVIIGEILFQNYYTFSLSVSCKRISSNEQEKASLLQRNSCLYVLTALPLVNPLLVDHESLPWEKCINKMMLMEDPNCEQGSQDIISIDARQSSIPWIGVLNLRFILRQPSSIWKKFGVENLLIYKESPEERKVQPEVPDVFKPGGSAPESAESQVQGDSYLENVALHLQNMWAIIELAKEKQSNDSVGRFEVEGSYDISHLIFN